MKAMGKGEREVKGRGRKWMGIRLPSVSVVSNLLLHHWEQVSQR